MDSKNICFKKMGYALILELAVLSRMKIEFYFIKKAEMSFGI